MGGQVPQNQPDFDQGQNSAAHVAGRRGRFGAEAGDYTSWPVLADANVPTRLSDSDPHLHKQEEINQRKDPRYDQMNQVIAEYVDPDYEASGQEDTINARESLPKQKDTASGSYSEFGSQEDRTGSQSGNSERADVGN